MRPKPMRSPMMKAIVICPLKNADIIDANLRAKNIASAFVFGLIKPMLFSRNAKKSNFEVSM